MKTIKLVSEKYDFLSIFQQKCDHSLVFHLRSLLHIYISGERE